jgi:hypothetical protein
MHGGARGGGRGRGERELKAEMMPPDSQARMAAAAQAVAPLVRLCQDAGRATAQGRRAAALELWERAAALAGASPGLPPDNLLAPYLLHELCAARVALSDGVRAAAAAQRDARGAAAAADAAWRADDEGAALRPLALRALAALHARFLAGTLFKPTLPEIMFFTPLQRNAVSAGAETLLGCARDAARCCAPLDDAAARALGDALRTALQLEAAYARRDDPRDRHPVFGAPLLELLHCTVIGAPAAEAAPPARRAHGQPHARRGGGGAPPRAAPAVIRCGVIE